MVAQNKQQLIETDKLIPYEQNIKKHTKTQVEGIAESIRRFGWYAPIMVDKNYVVVIGHGRLEAAKFLGLDKVPVIVKDDVGEDELRALRLLDNRISESAWDIDNLKIELEALQFPFENFKVNFDDLYQPKLQDISIDIDPSDQHMNSYLNGNIKQITLFFDNASFEKTMMRLEKAGQELGSKSNTDTVIKLLEFYESKE